MASPLTAEPALCRDPDIAPVAALFADPTRARIVAALTDGRALAASVIAAEAGVAASTTSEHLTRLLRGGVVTVRRSGRHRYYQLASVQVATAIEALSAIAPQPPVRSLRQSTRAHAMRLARTCYDHLAGRYGVAVTEGLVHAGALVRADGGSDARRNPADRLAAPVRDHPYTLGPDAGAVLARLGVDLDALLDRPGSARPLLRFCVDWSEQRHHLAGALGAAVLDAARDQGWIRTRSELRSVEVTESGRAAWADVLGVVDIGPHLATNTSTIGDPAR